MSLRRTRPLSEPARIAALQLRRAEGVVALLDRVRPLNWLEERARLTRACETGQLVAPAFEYAPRADLSEVRAELQRLARPHDASDPEQQLLAGRALELDREAALAEQIGGSTFAELAALRFALPPPTDALGACVESFSSAPVHPAEQLLHVSDDARDPDSLWSQMARLLARADQRLRVEIVPGLVSLAAVAEGVVRIRGGAKLTANVARRIALHEVEGHLLPRARGQELGGVFSAATAGASEDEEGRAIWLEERAELLDAERRRELGRRYVAAESLRRGADFWQIVGLLRARGASAAGAVELACRVSRGGGLGRELIYLSGYLRVVSRLGPRPELVRVLEHGRVSLDAAALLLSGAVELDDHRDVI